MQADKSAADKPAAAFHEAMQVKVYNMLIEINICFGYNKCTISGRRHAGVWLRKGIQARVEVRDYEQYKAVYCSLCKTLGREYGLFARLTLSYDFTFAALLRLALSGECPGFHKSRCPFNPFAKCNAFFLLRRRERFFLYGGRGGDYDVL